MCVCVWCTRYCQNSPVHAKSHTHARTNKHIRWHHWPPMKTTMAGEFIGLNACGKYNWDIRWRSLHHFDLVHVWNVLEGAFDFSIDFRCIFGKCFWFSLFLSFSSVATQSLCSCCCALKSIFVPPEEKFSFQFVITNFIQCSFGWFNLISSALSMFDSLSRSSLLFTRSISQTEMDWMVFFCFWMWIPLPHASSDKNLHCSIVVSESN